MVLALVSDKSIEVLVFPFICIFFNLLASVEHFYPLFVEKALLVVISASSDTALEETLGNVWFSKHQFHGFCGVVNGSCPLAHADEFLVVVVENFCQGVF